MLYLWRHQHGFQYTFNNFKINNPEHSFRLKVIWIVWKPDFQLVLTVHFRHLFFPFSLK